MSLTSEERQRIVEEEMLRESVRQQAKPSKAWVTPDDFVLLMWMMWIFVGFIAAIGLFKWIYDLAH